MKKIFALGLSCILTASLFTGCGETPPPAGNSEPQPIKLGTLKYLNADENLLDENIKNSPIKHTFIIHNNITTLKMALESGQIDEICTYKTVADYLMARDPKLEDTQHKPYYKISDNFAFAMRAEDTALKEQIDTAIDSMKTDGTLENLTKTYITDLKGTDDPPAVEFEKFDGAETLKIGVTGDLPPLDFISADGKVAGFNTALISEIGKRLQRNIEIIQIDSGARAAALKANKIDISFWAVSTSDEAILPDLDKPEGLELSSPYFQDSGVHLTLKK